MDWNNTDDVFLWVGNKFLWFIGIFLVIILLVATYNTYNITYNSVCVESHQDSVYHATYFYNPTLKILSPNGGYTAKETICDKYVAK